MHKKKENIIFHLDTKYIHTHIIVWCSDVYRKCKLFYRAKHIIMIKHVAIHQFIFYIVNVSLYESTKNKIVFTLYWYLYSPSLPKKFI